jgi:hypothetical protein
MYKRFHQYSQYELDKQQIIHNEKKLSRLKEAPHVLSDNRLLLVDKYERGLIYNFDDPTKLNGLTKPINEVMSLGNNQWIARHHGIKHWYHYLVPENFEISTWKLSETTIYHPPLLVWDTQTLLLRKHTDVHYWSLCKYDVNLDTVFDQTSVYNCFTLPTKRNDQCVLLVNSKLGVNQWDWRAPGWIELIRSMNVGATQCTMFGENILKVGNCVYDLRFPSAVYQTLPLYLQMVSLPDDHFAYYTAGQWKIYNNWELSASLSILETNSPYLIVMKDSLVICSEYGELESRRIL